MHVSGVTITAAWAAYLCVCPFTTGSDFAAVVLQCHSASGLGQNTQVVFGGRADQYMLPVAPLNLMTMTEILSLLPRAIAVLTMVVAICFVEMSSWHKPIAS